MTSRILSLMSALVFLSGPVFAADEELTRGEYLVRHVMACGSCHTPLGANGPVPGKELAGRFFEDNQAFTIYSTNLTPASRIAGWSDEELGRAIREGIRPDGSLIGPPMPFGGYRGISDSDLASIVAFLRTLPPVENDLPDSVYRIPLPPAYGPKVDTVPHPEEGVSASYGEYLGLNLAHCMACHSTPSARGGPDYENNLGRGGREFHGPWGTSVASNITNHADGLAYFSDDEIRKMIAEGTRPDGRKMLPPMPYGNFSHIKEDDLKAIIAYLRKVPGLPDK